MGYWADGLILGQKPRKNGCPCAVVILVMAVGALGSTLWGAVQVVT